MTKIRPRGERARKFILDNLVDHPRDIVNFTVKSLNITQPAVQRHLQLLINEKSIVTKGKGRGKGLTYFLAPTFEWNGTYNITSSSSEGVIWNEISQKLSCIPENAKHIWQYGITEMYNNVIDHSNSESAAIYLKQTSIDNEIIILDYGMGIFKKIQEALKLIDARQAVLELAKGKFTTDPEKHSGEGIFFASRMFDNFVIYSSGVFFSHDYGNEEDWILEDNNIKGTIVRMRLNNHTARSTKKVFDEYADIDYGFNKTVVPVRLCQYGDDQLVSRSQAKRLLVRIDKFRTVIFDFKGVTTVGQAFADEIFRVFCEAHPKIELVEINTCPDVAAMISRAKILATEQKQYINNFDLYT
jgi:anti-sigma regulatory factor (Ser/Thr protein kinase)